MGGGPRDGPAPALDIARAGGDARAGRRRPGAAERSEPKWRETVWGAEYAGEGNSSRQVTNAGAGEGSACFSWYLNYAQVHLGPLGNLFYNSRDAELALREPLPRSHPNGG